MNWLVKLPGSKRSPPGLEWALWKRLPAIFGLGSAAPLAVAAVLWWASPGDADLAQHRAAMVSVYRLIGLMLLHWSFVLTAAIGCAIVMVMKGPAYVADSLPLPCETPPA